MKHLHKIVLMVLFTVIASTGQATSLIESTLTTPDQKCSVHYWSNENTDGWYLQPVAGLCPNGYLNGVGRVTVRNQDGHVIHSLDGAFVQGYPVGSQMIYYPLTGANHDRENMILTFDMGEDTQTGTHFFGRLSLPDLGADPMTPPNVQPLRILIQTRGESLFYSEESQRRLIGEAMKRGKELSPSAMQLHLFGTTKTTPRQEDIIFFAEADLSLNQVKVRRRPKPQESGVPYPKEIRQEAGVPVVRILPSVQDPSQGGVPSPTQIIQPNLPTAPEAPNLPIAAAPDSVKTISPTLSQNLSSTEVASPLPPKENLSQLPEPDTGLDKIPHLLTSSRLLKQPIQGKALIHIARFDGAGRVIIDQPVSLSAKGSGLSLGWGIAEGYFSSKPDTQFPDTLGFIDITAFAPTEDGSAAP